jgi:hypothetical protein
MTINELVEGRTYHCTNYRDGKVWDEHLMIYRGCVRLTVDLINRMLARNRDAGRDYPLRVGDFRYHFVYAECDTGHDDDQGVLFVREGVESNVDYAFAVN